MDAFAGNAPKPDTTVFAEYEALLLMPIGQRLWSKAIPDANTGCLVWGGAKTGAGYGEIWWAGKVQGAHRLACTLANGPIPEGQVVRHRCNNTLCIRPSHLAAGTYRENLADTPERGPLARRQKTDLRETITEADWEAISSILARGRITQVELAEIYGMSTATLRRGVAKVRSREAVA
jgi:hypothetical protein